MLYFLFFCSGVSGLIYQVLWVRAFGAVFGNTVYSASFVIASFMFGLGAGGYIAGRWADRRYTNRPDSLLQVFGSFEIAIGALALGVFMLLPHLGELSAAISAYERGPDGWHTLTESSYVARAIMALVLLTPITLLMGGTLTLLIRYVVREDVRAGTWRIALLYAANTAGAAIGCFLTDFALVPAYGLQRTQLVAFLLNLVAGLGAVALARAPGSGIGDQGPGTGDQGAAVLRSSRAQRRPIADPRSPIPDPRSPIPIRSTALAIALSGFAAMGMEIVWFRHFSMLLGEYRAVFSELLTVILCGIGLGSLAGGWLARRVEPAHAWIAAQALFVVSTLAGLTRVDARQLRDAITAAAAQPALEGWPRTFAEFWFNAWPILFVVAVPALIMGAAFPLANAVVQRVEQRVGRRAGVLYLANTAGAVCGSLVAGFVLLPVVGMQASVTVLVAIAGAAIVPLWRGSGIGDRGSGFRRSIPLGAAAVALGAWLLLPQQYLVSKGLLFPLEKAYAVSEGLTEVIAVTDGPNGGRVLVTNGHPMSSTELFSQRYMRAMAHIPLLAHERPTRVLVICYGVGNTAHAVSLHPSVERLEIVDLSRHVLEHSRYFEDVNQGVLRDPRVAVYINDGRHHLRMQRPGAYDLITLEPPPVVHAGVAALYSREFYESARSRLAPKGFLTQWLPVFGVRPDVVLAMARAFLDVFPNAVLLSGANMHLLLLGANDARNEIDPARMAAALARAPDVQADLARLDLGTLREIVGTFVAPAPVLVEATRASTPVTDDRPLQEYGRRSLLDFGEGGIPSSLVAVHDVAAWCPGCFADGRPLAAIEGIDAYLSLLELAYRAPADRSGSDPRLERARQTRNGRVIAGSGYLGSIVPDSPEAPQLIAALESRTAAPGARSVGRVQDAAADRYARATALLEAGRFHEAIDGLRAVLQLRPDAADARNNLGVALASVGRLDEAIEEFRRALAIRPGFADAERNLAMALQKR